MHEEHDKEQYFFDLPTLDRLANFVRGFERPLLLCCPMLGRRLWEAGVVAPTLDVDDRFADLPGYLRWDIYNPQALGTNGPAVTIRTHDMAPYDPDLLIIDPPFNIVRLDQLYAAVRVLTNDRVTGLMITNTPKKAIAVMSTFAKYALAPTGYKPTFVSVPSAIGIEFYGNVNGAHLAPLLEPD